MDENDSRVAFKIAEILLNDEQELIHKGTGRALCYAADKDPERLLSFLDEHAASLPRIALRSAIEYLDKK